MNFHTMKTDIVIFSRVFTMRNLNFYIFLFENMEKGTRTAREWSARKNHRGGRKIVILFISKRYHISIKNCCEKDRTIFNLIYF